MNKTYTSNPLWVAFSEEREYRLYADWHEDADREALNEKVKQSIVREGYASDVASHLFRTSYLVLDLTRIEALTEPQFGALVDAYFRSRRRGWLSQQALEVIENAILERAIRGYIQAPAGVGLE